MIFTLGAVGVYLGASAIGACCLLYKYFKLVEATKLEAANAIRDVPVDSGMAPFKLVQEPPVADRCLRILTDLFRTFLECVCPWHYWNCTYMGTVRGVVGLTILYIIIC